MTSRVLGVLGGMGPLATVDFLRKLIEETPATRDQEHVPTIVYSVPQIPERPAAILGTGESPLPHMLKGIRTLREAGAGAIAIPCNTAHYWYDELVRAGGLPIIHIADAACDALRRTAGDVATVGLIATKGTIAAGFFQQRLAARDLKVVVSTSQEQDELVLPAIEAVKRNSVAEAHPLAVRACEALVRRGARAVILACTETPLAMEYADSATGKICVDATRALAHACAAWHANRGDIA